MAKTSLLDPETIKSPFPYYEFMRSEDPVHWDAKASAFLVTRYEDIAQAVRMNDSLSIEFGHDASHEPWHGEIVELMNREGLGPHDPADNFLVEPPRHARRRGLVDKALSGQSVADMEAHVTAIVHDVTNRFIDRGEADMVTEFAIPTSIWVIADLLGVTRDRVEDFKRWSDAAVVPLGRGITKEQAIKYARDLCEMQHFLHDQIEIRRNNPADDLISRLVHSRLEGDQTGLSEKELLSCCVALLAAGNETTRNGISWSAYLLGKEPRLIDELRDAEDHNKAYQRFVEESLRLQPPVPQLPRMALKDCELGGVKIPKGSFVWLCWASANRDATKFENAETFDIDRKNVGRHMTFGQGIHRCVGSMLARMEMKCAVREIVTRMSNYKLVNKGDPDLWGTFVFRGPRSLPVTFTKIPD